ncbi:MAG: hypothetical protein JJ897_03640 [Marinibacterium sp.]|nr:hypothetical protein [Marinibacterium sp.]
MSIQKIHANEAIQSQSLSATPANTAMNLVEAGLLGGIYRATPMACLTATNSSDYRFE